ncbi:MAG: hypothetical protein AAGI44_04525 [Pseudomonadota bacterium]
MTTDTASNRFLELFGYELQNRALAFHAMSKAEVKARGTDQYPYWSAYKELEVGNQARYAAYARAHSLPMDMGSKTRLLAWFLVTISMIVPQRIQFKMTWKAAVDHVKKMEELCSLAPLGDKAFFQYVVDQERVQAVALKHASEGDLKAAAGALEAFVASRPSEF